LESIKVEVSFKRDEGKNISSFIRKIHFTGDLEEEQRKRLLEIADKCPIHKALSGQIHIETSDA
ncbi:MAG TPA: OsmC family protein, partial [Nitrosopumilaceae archaeon]|nr:OsmC family protein [Nitrosopumilaceae archaeon]